MLHIILGLASRLCDGDPAVWHDPNVENCSTVVITEIREEVNNLMAVVKARNISNHTLLSIFVQNITNDLARNTEINTTNTIFPNDLQTAIYIISDIIRLIYKYLAAIT